MCGVCMSVVCAQYILERYSCGSCACLSHTIAPSAPSSTDNFQHFHLTFSISNHYKVTMLLQFRIHMDGGSGSGSDKNRTDTVWIS